MISWSLSKFELISTTFFFIVSKEKCWKTNLQSFSIFPFVRPPLETMKKSCWNEHKFWEASRNYKSSPSWKFHNSILKIAKTSQLSASISEKVFPQIFLIGAIFTTFNSVKIQDLQFRNWLLCPLRWIGQRPKTKY